MPQEVIPTTLESKSAAKARRAATESLDVSTESNSFATCSAYGLAFRGVEGISRLLPAEPTWPGWDVFWRPPRSEDEGAARGLPRCEEWSVDHALLFAQPNGTILLDRASRSTTFLMPEPPSPEALAHPYLASTGVVAGHWLGKTPFHAGAFALDGRVWGVLGVRGMGKTSTLMGLHLTGVPVFTDDVLVVDAGTATVFRGPRCLDLRKDAAERFAEGLLLGVVGTRERWRVELPPVECELPLGGWVLLSWGESTSIEEPTASTRLAGLAAHRGLVAAGTTATGLLDLVTLPMVVFCRERGWDKFDEGLDRLRDALAGM